MRPSRTDPDAGVGVGDAERVSGGRVENVIVAVPPIEQHHARNVLPGQRSVFGCAAVFRAKTGKKPHRVLSFLLVFAEPGLTAEPLGGLRRRRPVRPASQVPRRPCDLGRWDTLREEGMRAND